MQRVSLAAFAAVTAISFTVDAHPTVASGNAFANKGSQKITFGLGHGCDGADTIKIKIEIPTTVTSVRALYSDFGRPAITRDPNNPNPQTNIRSIEWTKTDTELDTDFAFYEFTLRGRIADVPFSKQQFNVTQTCKLPGQTATTVLWDQPPDATSGEPAPILNVVPQRIAGWNRFVLTTAVAVDDLPVFFGDAQIVWRGTEAFSTNSNTRAMIQGTTGVTELTTGLAIGDEIWVKY